MSWARRPPEPPPRGTGSDWYWYWADGEKEPWVTEVYYGCWQLYNGNGWWHSDPVPKPSDAPPFRGRKRITDQNLPKIDSKKEELQKAIQSMPEELIEELPPVRYRGRGLL